MIKVFKNTDEIGNFLGEMLVGGTQALGEGEYFTIALSGGSTPKAIFRHLASNYREKVTWDRLKVFWGDERCVPPGDAESNYAMATESLLSRVPVPAGQVFRIRGEEDPLMEAVRYDGLVRQHVTNIKRPLAEWKEFKPTGQGDQQHVPDIEGSPAEWKGLKQTGRGVQQHAPDCKGACAESGLTSKDRTPAFDMVLLGLGEDGHTASIFPDSMHLLQSDDLFAEAKHPDTGQIRITATGRLINHAKNVVFIVTGASKAGMIARVVNREAGWEKLPAAHITPMHGNLLWLLDEAASSPTLFQNL